MKTHKHSAYLSLIGHCPTLAGHRVFHLDWEEHAVGKWSSHDLYSRSLVLACSITCQEARGCVHRDVSPNADMAGPSPLALHPTRKCERMQQLLRAGLPIISVMTS